MFKKKQPPAPERRMRAPQSPAVRSNAVFSYHANRSVRETSQYRDSSREEKEAASRGRRRYVWLRRLPNLATLLAIIVAAAFCLQLRGQAKIETVGTPEGKLFLRDPRAYDQAVQSAFEPWANHNKLTINTDKISSDLRRQFPELQVVSVSLPLLGNQPTVYLQPAIPKLILVGRSGMYVLDVNGRALIAGNQVAKLPELHVPAVNDQSGIPLEAGNIALPRATVRFITEVVGQLSAKQLTISSMILPTGTNELHVQLERVGYTVKFNLHGDAREETGAFLAVKQHVEASRKLPREYIDVRVENKAYYR